MTSLTLRFRIRLGEFRAFEAWEKTIEESLSPSKAVKLVMGGDNAEDAPPAGTQVM